MTTGNAGPPPPTGGIIPPLITPLAGRDRLDEPGLDRLIEHVIAGGVHGLFVLGTTGEAPSLSYRLRREVVTRTCRRAAGRVPVLVGITDTSCVESLALARFAADAGASAVVLSAPYYFPAGQPELVEYLQHIVPDLPRPALLYNIPLMTKVALEPETVRRAMDLDGVVGLKDSSGDLDYFRRIREMTRRRKDWTLLVGPEALLARAMRLGGDGGVAGGANLCPRLFVDLYDAAVRGDEARVDELDEWVRRLGGLYTIGRHASAVIKGLKCALALGGVCDDFMAEPMHRFRRPEREQVRRLLDTLQPHLPLP